MSIMTRTLAMTAFVLGLTQFAHAGACITGFREGAFTPVAVQDDGPFYGATIYTASLTCQELDTWKMALRAASYTFSITGLGLACTPVGTPVAVGMFGVGTILYTADLVINSLPCEDGSEQKVEKLVKIEVCKALTAQGIECDPNTMVRK